MDCRAIVSRWFAGIGAAARSKYSLALRKFEVWATGSTDPQPERCLRLLVDAGRVGARQLALGWRADMEARGRASGTIAGMMSALASLVTAARLCGLVEWHLEAIAPKVQPRHDRSGPPRHEVELLLARIDDEAATGDPHAIRDAAIVRLLHGAALRRFEVVGLRLCDVQLDHTGGPRVLPLRKGKREREPMLIGPMAAESLRRWLAIRGEVAPDAPVFVRLHAAASDDGPLSGEAVRLMLRSRAKRAGVRAPCRPHGLRHAAASHCARYASLAALRRLGGWDSLAGPSKYLDQDDRDRLEAVVAVEC